MTIKLTIEEAEHQLHEAYSVKFNTENVHVTVEVPTKAGLVVQTVEFIRDLPPYSDTTGKIANIKALRQYMADRGEYMCLHDAKVLIETLGYNTISA